jgi:phytoene dehydrogenase-like protein
MTDRFDAIVVGGGHNGLVAATMLAQAGWAVLVLERADRVGGAAVSAALWPGVDARLSRYSYLVSLFPAELARELGLELQLRRRRVSSYTPVGEGGLLVHGDHAPSSEWAGFYGALARAGERVFPTLTEPLRSREALRALVDDEPTWRAVFEEPLAVALERAFSSDTVRGVVLTDALIGTFAPAGDAELRQNRCFLYHVIGNGTGHWDVPVGGMGALTDALADRARGAGADIRTRAEVTRISTDGTVAEVETADGERFAARHVLAGAAPSVLARLLGEGETPAGAGAGAGPGAGPGPRLGPRPGPGPGPRPGPGPGPVGARAGPEGSQLKLNMLLRRLPRLRDRAVAADVAFAGTFHVNEGYEQLQVAFEQAAAGAIPQLPPCEVYCHSLTDPSILGQDLRAAGAHTLTLFGLHMPARLFRADPAGAKQAAVAATLRSLDAVLAEPIEECLWVAPDGTPCLEALTPVELESELAMPGGHIFHRDLAWPYAEVEAELGGWGVETAHPNVWLCGAGARRGGGVSGIPGHNGARAVLAAG